MLLQHAGLAAEVNVDDPSSSIFSWMPLTCADTGNDK